MRETHKKTTQTTDRNIDLGRLVQALLKRAWLIILVAVISGVLVFCCSKLFITPTYRSSFTAYVNNRHSTAEGEISTSTSDISASRSLTYLYQEIIRSRSVLLDAAEACGLTDSYGSLYSRVSTSVATNAAIIYVNVEAYSPEDAEQLAAAIAQVAPEHVARVVEGSSMRIVDYPVLPDAPYAPNSMKHGLVGFAVALVLMVALVVLLDVIVDKLESSREMEERYGITVVGIIPDMQQADKYQYAAAEERPRRR